MTATGAGAPGAALRILVVCTGNICRSPAAELLMQAGLGPAADVEVTSAGLHAVVGDPVAAPMARLLRAQGVDPAEFSARQLEARAARDADLVLTMTAAQRRRVVTVAPSAVRRSFTLVEFAEVAELAEVDRLPGGPAERIAAALRAAPRARALRGRAKADDDIEDPYGRTDDVFARVFDAIDAAVGRLLRQVGDPRSERAGTTHGDVRGRLPALTRTGGDTR